MKKPWPGQYDYSRAFSRNLGWVSEEEQSIIAGKKVAIAGMGGVGGHYAEVMARLGVTKFHIADFDDFEIHNFNRQNGSGMETLQKKKAEIIKLRILDINPDAKITVFEEGVTSQNVDSFLEGVDLYLDGLDFFVMKIRRMIFEKTRTLGIGAVTVAPVGMGAALVVFNRNSMSFDEHFGINDSDSVEDTAFKFLLGLTPSLKQLKYLVDRSRGNFKEKRAPSLPMGVYLCAGVAGTEALKFFLNKGKVKASPWVLHFDAYLQNYHKTYLWWGKRNPIQKMKLFIIKKFFSRFQQN